MNLILLHPGELSADGTALLRGRRARHAREVLQAAGGDTLRAGVLDGQVGTATVLSVGADEVHLQVALDAEPPPRANLDLVLAIPRPKALKKVLPALASLGVNRIVLVNAARVEKSYFDSKVLEPTFVEGLLDLGLEQARDTRRPQLLVRERFRPFVEDELPAFAAGARRLVAHPTGAVEPESLGLSRAERVVLAVGPEGGWVPFEVELLAAQQFVPVTLGPRILRVEVAVPYLLGRLDAARARGLEHP